MPQQKKRLRITGLDDDALAILAFAKTRIYRYFLGAELRSVHEDPLLVWRRTLSRSYWDQKRFFSRSGSAYSTLTSSKKRETHSPQEERKHRWSSYTPGSTKPNNSLQVRRMTSDLMFLRAYVIFNNLHTQHISPLNSSAAGLAVFWIAAVLDCAQGQGQPQGPVLVLAVFWIAAVLDCAQGQGQPQQQGPVLECPLVLKTPLPSILRPPPGLLPLSSPVLQAQGDLEKYQAPFKDQFQLLLVILMILSGYQDVIDVASHSRHICK
ncbi:hypothetical protein LAZ67_11002972 [Cordylochernes scorpioides]|uniref:Uncharacterized protein n=1 Tax=Cordylochernes scorpioides TaxID=51811 RepID=A0ABY6L313_9ARAC|nr:hypothetical protein LAZ67_11002972 [Cordylochernes scorpioides]